MGAHSNWGKKGTSMKQLGLVMCPKCGYLWNLNADDQYIFVLFEDTIVTCPKCYRRVGAVIPIVKINQQYSGGFHATKV